MEVERELNITAAAAARKKKKILYEGCGGGPSTHRAGERGLQHRRGHISGPQRGYVNCSDRSLNI